MWDLKVSSERFFGGEERRQVEALFEAIIPGDETSPGAADADAAEYLDRFLALDESYYYEIPGWKKLYRDGLPALDAACAKINGGKSLIQLSPDELIGILDRLSKGQLAEMPSGFDQRLFFSTLRGHCIEACFADPRWGGNRDAVIWRWYGYLNETTDFERQPSGELKEVRRDG